MVFSVTIRLKELLNVVKKFLRLMAAAPQIVTMAPARAALARFATPGIDPFRKRTMLESWSALALGSRAATGKKPITYRSCGIEGDTEMIGRDFHIALARHMAKVKAMGRHVE